MRGASLPGLQVPKRVKRHQGPSGRGCVCAALDGTVESVADTERNREAFRYSTDDEVSHRPFPQARLLLMIECATVLHCDVEISDCRQAEANGVRRLVERWRLEKSLILWDSGFHGSRAVFDVRARGGHVLGREATQHPPQASLHAGRRLLVFSLSIKTKLRRRGERMLVRVITYTFTDSRIEGGRKAGLSTGDDQALSLSLPGRRVGRVVS
jgi:hypothetical protein